jgi:hypothetical protein
MTVFLVAVAYSTLAGTTEAVPERLCRREVDRGRARLMGPGAAARDTKPASDQHGIAVLRYFISGVGEGVFTFGRCEVSRIRPIGAFCGLFVASA